MTLCELCRHFGNCPAKSEMPEDKREKIWMCTNFKHPEDVIRINYGDSPFDIANKFISATVEILPVIGNAFTHHFFDKEELLKIGKHLINYVETEGVENET